VQLLQACVGMGHATCLLSLARYMPPLSRTLHASSIRERGIEKVKDSRIEYAYAYRLQASGVDSVVVTVWRGTPFKEASLHPSRLKNTAQRSMCMSMDLKLRTVCRGIHFIP